VAPQTVAPPTPRSDEILPALEAMETLLVALARTGAG
jgi:hypothetical protein